LKKFIIDADTGSDDAVAILLALQDPSVEILGISVVSGNVPLRQGIKNTISTIDMTEKKVKVYAGADKPISREYEEIYDLEN
jgi:inosine-uridine nucleoside N-ribohydrolase